MYSILLSSIFNIAIIAIALDLRILGWYFGACAILFISNYLFKSKISKASLNLLNSRKKLSNVMLSAWENIFIGNKYNLKNWQEKFKKNIEFTTKFAVSYDITRSIVSGITVSAALIIISIGNGVYYFENSANLVAIAALLITFPRQIQIIQNIFAFFNLLLSWQGVREQLKQVTSIIDLSAKQKNLEPFIKFEHISFFNGEKIKQYANFSDIIYDLNITNKGRITLRGKNGTGKSTVLTYLAEYTADASFYLPSNNSELAFINSSIISQSDGNKIRHIFSELLEIHGIKFIFLDEWDANLDDENINKIDDIIKKLSNEKVVVEARHRS